MRILEIEAENFKLFNTKFEVKKDLNKADLILLNGPNGYGKTSVFDILEFCLTGEIGRINQYTQELEISRNEIGENKILIGDETKSTYIKVVLEYAGKKIEIKYNCPPQNKEKKASKENNPHNIFQCFNRYIYCDGKEIQNQKEFLKRLQLDDIGEWFDKCCFLSQDEHLQFLKEARKSKARAISFLFQIPPKWEEERNKLQYILDELSNRRRKNPLAYIVRLEEKEEKLKNKVQELEGKIDSHKISDKGVYKHLFEGEEFFWDQENISLNLNAYEVAIKEVDELIYFAEHKEECIDYLFNMPYRGYNKEFNGAEKLSCIEYPLEYAYRFYNLIINEQQLEKRYAIESKERILLECIQKKEYNNINWEFIDEEKILNKDEIAEICEKLDIIKNLESTHGILEKTMVAIKQARNNLLEHVRVAIDYKNIDSTKCPLCGAPYEDWIEVERHIKDETEVLNKLSSDSVNKIHIINEKLYESFFANIERKILKEQKGAVSEKIYTKLQEVKKYKSEIMDVNKNLQKLDISLPVIFEESITEINKGYNILLQELRGKLKKVQEEVEVELDNKNFMEKYDKFYDNKEEKFLQISAKDLQAKKEYIKILYYNYNIKSLDDTKEDLEKIKKRQYQLNKVIDQLTYYKNAIDDGIREYKKKIIADVEPLLHVYTAKILQQKFNGKSIFIFTDEKIENVQFINSINDKQDILYSMSSGQLSAVALAFLLCMNQVYSSRRSCSLLMIDDPVQTVDDVNMVGFVDILRYSFADRQIFISTHEQKFEWFLRYRYAKSGKMVKLLNMKELLLQEGEIDNQQ